jgi:sRNA-binding regulator protein Hfq
MKEGNDSTAVGRAPEADSFTARKLIRPSLTRAEGNNRPPEPALERREPRVPGQPKKTPPPEQTHAENFYYQKQMQARTPMVVVLKDGEEIRGIIEWYDRSCIKVNRAGQPNVLLYKSCIKYIFKEAEDVRK